MGSWSLWRPPGGAGGGQQAIRLNSNQKDMVRKYAEPIRERVYLPNNSETGVQVGKATGGQRGAAGGELQERLPLVRRHPAQNPDEAQEPGTVGQSREKSHLQEERNQATRPLLSIMMPRPLIINI